MSVECTLGWLESCSIQPARRSNSRDSLTCQKTYKLHFWRISLEHTFHHLCLNRFIKWAKRKTTPCRRPILDWNRHHGSWRTFLLRLREQMRRTIRVNVTLRSARTRWQRFWLPGPVLNSYSAISWKTLSYLWWIGRSCLQPRRSLQPAHHLRLYAEIIEHCYGCPASFQRMTFWGPTLLHDQRNNRDNTRLHSTIKTYRFRHRRVPPHEIQHRTRSK